MKVVLLRDQRILHKAGEIVEVSPVVFDNLIQTNSAVLFKEAVEQEKPRKTRKAAK